jgi:hypothetical protein
VGVSRVSLRGSIELDWVSGEVFSVRRERKGRKKTHNPVKEEVLKRTEVSDGPETIFLEVVCSIEASQYRRTESERRNGERRKRTRVELVRVQDERNVERNAVAHSLEVVKVQLEPVDRHRNKHAPSRFRLEASRPTRRLRLDRLTQSVEGTEELEVGLDFSERDEGRVLFADAVRGGEVDKGRWKLVGGV